MTLTRVTRAAVRVQRRREAVADAEAALVAAVRDALAAGVPAVRVAEALGVTRGRVYQIRDGKR